MIFDILSILIVIFAVIAAIILIINSLKREKNKCGNNNGNCSCS